MRGEDDVADEEKELQAKDGAPEEATGEGARERKPRATGARKGRAQGARAGVTAEGAAEPEAGPAGEPSGPAEAVGDRGDRAPRHAAAERPARRAAGEHAPVRPARKEEPPGPQDDAEELPEPLARALERIRGRFPDVRVRGRRDLWLEVTVEPTRLVEVATFLRDDPELRFDYLALLTGVDRLDEGFELVNHLTSLEKGLRLILRTRVPRDEPKCPSLTGVWPGANWHERETYDLLGVRFEGHPDLRRILLREDWEGHPLRKDYVDRRPPRRIQVKAEWERKA